MSKILRAIALAGVIGLLLLVVILSVTKKPNYAEKVWDERATMGVAAEEAEHHFIMYTDVMCPYCNFAARLMIDNDEELRNYLEENKIVFEVRMTDFLYEYGEHKTNNSRQSGEAVYCAKNSTDTNENGSFWEYYHGAVDQIWNDYIVNGVGSSSTAPEISELDDSYWLAIGTKLGLGEEFKNCYKNREALSELQNNTARAYNAVESGLPQFMFDNYSSSGFSPTWGWDEFRQMLEAGLHS